MSTAAKAFAFAILIAVPGTPAFAQGPAPIPASRQHEFNSVVIARQLGTTLAPNHDVEFLPGVSVTGALSDPSRLARYGFAGVQAGARVTTMRVAEDRIVVEVDESDPSPRTRRVMLRIDSSGRVVGSPLDRQTPKEKSM
jgi:hypothetical protein